MFPEKPELTITIPSKTELLKMLVELTRHVAIINHFSLSDARKIALAVDEAITNAIKHSYKGGEEGNISLEFYPMTNGLKTRIIFGGVPPVLEELTIDLKKMIKAGKLSKNIVLEFGTDYPMRLSFRMLDKMSLQFVLAPRVEE